MNNKIKAPSSVILAVLTVITIFFWIGFSVFRIFTTKPDAVVPREIIAPLSPTLDATTLTKLQQRVYLTDEEIGTTKIDITALSSEPEEVEPTASPAAGLDTGGESEGAEEDENVSTSSGQTSTIN